MSMQLSHCPCVSCHALDEGDLGSCVLILPPRLTIKLLLIRIRESLVSAASIRVLSVIVRSRFALIKLAVGDAANGKACMRRLGLLPHRWYDVFLD